GRCVGGGGAPGGLSLGELVHEPRRSRLSLDRGHALAVGRPDRAPAARRPRCSRVALTGGCQRTEPAAECAAQPRTDAPCTASSGAGALPAPAAPASRAYSLKARAPRPPR